MGSRNHNLLFCLKFVTLVSCQKIESVFSVQNIQMLFMYLDHERMADVEKEILIYTKREKTLFINLTVLY